MAETHGCNPKAYSLGPRLATTTLLSAIGLLLGLSAAPVAGQKVSPAFEAKVKQAETILEEMGVAYAAISSLHYRLLFAGKRDFAVQRRIMLEATRRNFLGFIRRFHLKVNADHEMLLVILLDNERQMHSFSRRASDGESKLPEWAAGYYDPDNNWSVFYNQRNGQELKRTEQTLNQMAQRLLSIPGGPDTVVRLQLPSGPVDKSKRLIAREMEAEWARVIREMARFNTVVTQHEGAHQIAYNTGVQNRNAVYPFWLSEGLACVFEVPPDRKGRRRGAARINRDRLSAFREILRDHRNLGIEATVAVGKENPPVEIRAAYAESWAMFAFLFDRHTDELSKYMQHLARRSGHEASEQSGEVDIFRQFFKTPLPALQKQFDAYIIALSKRR